MPPVLGNIIVICILAVVLFFCGKSVLRSIRAELKGEGTCAGCNGSCHTGKKGSAECRLQNFEELESLIKK